MGHMAMVNMKIDPKTREEQYAESPVVDRPIYPWGLEVRLDNDALDKLGLTSLPEVGAAQMLHARVEVTAVSERDSVENGKPKRQRDLTLQITDLALGPMPAEKKAALYEDKAE